jgi:hypothetical protein
MKIALFLNDEKLKAMNAEAFAAFLLEIADNIIVSVENDLLYSKNLNYISLWLLKKQVNILYILSADDTLRSYFKRIDVEVKTFEDLKDNPILNLFLR